MTRYQQNKRIRIVSSCLLALLVILLCVSQYGCGDSEALQIKKSIHSVIKPSVIASLKASRDYNLSGHTSISFPEAESLSLKVKQVNYPAIDIFEVKGHINVWWQNQFASEYKVFYFLVEVEHELVPQSRWSIHSVIFHRTK